MFLCFVIVVLAGCSINKTSKTGDIQSASNERDKVIQDDVPTSSNKTKVKDTNVQKDGSDDLYTNTKYGFSFTLPENWKGYTIVNGTWEGFALGGETEGKIVETNALISIRHPHWTSQSPMQDIPIMIFTLEQWDSLQQEKFHIGSAPVNPSELGRNKNYVFALPARYNFACLPEYEEVENILKGNPLKTALKPGFDNLKNIKGFTPIESQSFMVSLDSWGNVKFVSGKLTGGNQIPTVFYLTDESGNILYSFEDTPFPYSVDVKAVSFTDVNKDGLKDIIIIVTDAYKASSDFGKAIAAVWLQNTDGKFTCDLKLWDWDGYNRSEEFNFWCKMSNKYGKNVISAMGALGEAGAYMTKKGYRVTVIDYTKEMIDEGRKRYGDLDFISFLCADICKFDLEKKEYDFCFIGSGDLHLLTEEADIKMALKNISTHLRLCGGLGLELWTVSDSSWTAPRRKFEPRVPKTDGPRIWKIGGATYDSTTKRNSISQTVYIVDNGIIETFEYSI